MADHPPDADGPFDTAAALAETLAFLELRRDPDADPEHDDADRGDQWIADTPDWFGAVLFGGFAISQAIMAATRNAPEGRRLHSLHAYFLRPVIGGKTLSFRVRTLREGRSFTSRPVRAASRRST